MFLLGVALSIAGALTTVVFMRAATRSFRRLVDYQFHHHHDAWVESGRPLSGSKVTRAEAAFWTSDAATWVCMLSWPIERPDWLPAESEGETYRRDTGRNLALAFAVGFPTFGLGMLVVHIFGG